MEANMGKRGEAGAALLFAVFALILIVASLGAAALGASASASARRDAASERALAQAREALLAYAAERPIDLRVGPGYLPCPDLDDDGWAEPTCGSLTGHLGHAERLGRLPWKTLGLPDLRDGSGERLWYAVSARHKGLLNCAQSRGCIDMAPPDALGTISVREAGGALLHDGTLADPARAELGGAAAIVIAPGEPITRATDGHPQVRACAPGECDARGRCLTDPPWRAARCDARNYLDATALEDNAAFRDRSGDGFVQGPVSVRGTLAVNDRIAIVGYRDLMPRVMRRIALEAAACLRASAAGPAGPAAPVDACGTSPHLGRIGDAQLGGPGCNASAAEPSWWLNWRDHVLYARAADNGLDVVDAYGQAIASGRRFAIVVTREARDCAPLLVSCGGTGCTRVLVPPPIEGHGDVVVASP
jgi:hypothetical protein